MAKKRNRIVLLIGIVLLILGGLLLFGWPQRVLLASSLERTLGTGVKVEGVSIFGPLYCDSLTIYDEMDKLHETPFAKLNGITVEYDLDAKDGRKIPQVRIDEVYLFPKASDTTEPNYQFLLNLLKVETTSGDVTWLPKNITIKKLAVAGHWQDEFIELPAMHLNASIQALDTIGVNIMFIDARKIDAWSGEISINIEEDTVWGMAKDLRVHLDGGTWNPVAQYFIDKPYIDFETISLDVPDLVWTPDWIGGTAGAELDVSIKGLTVRQSGELMYSGNVLVHANFPNGMKKYGEFSVQLHPGLLADVAINIQESNVHASMSFSQCAKPDLVEMLPESLKGNIQDLAFAKLSGDVDVYWSEANYAISGAVHSDGKVIDVDWALHGALESASGVLGQIDARLGTGLLKASGYMDDAGMYCGIATLKDVPLGPFALLAAGTPLPSSVSGLMNGEMSVQQLDAQRVELSPTIRFSELRYDAMEFPLLQLDGPVVLDYEQGVATAKKVLFQSEDESIKVLASDGNLQLDSGDLSAQLEFAFPIDLLNVKDIFGTLSGTAELVKINENWSVPVTIYSDYIGYGDLLLPYGSEMTGKGVVQFLDSGDDLKIVDAHIKMGEGTLLIFKRMAMAKQGWVGETEIKSDLSILVGMAYIAEVDGVLDVETHWSFPDSGFTMQWKAKSDIASMVLLDQAATVKGIVATLDAEYIQQYQGNGAISVESLDAAGATIADFSGLLTFEDNVLVVPSSSAKVFDGTLESRIDVNVMDEGLPVTFEGTLKNINLTQLSEEVQPPKTKLTGVADGKLSAEYSLSSGLLGFDLKAESENNFTLNRILVEELMQMQTVLGGLGEKRAKKAMAKFLGDAEQRPFDSAGINVFLIDSSVLGVVDLKSEKTKNYNGLNLVIQLDIDQSALVQSLKVLEESSLAEVES